MVVVTQLYGFPAEADGVVTSMSSVGGENVALKVPAPLALTLVSTVPMIPPKLGSTATMRLPCVVSL